MLHWEILHTVAPDKAVPVSISLIGKILSYAELDEDDKNWFNDQNLVYLINKQDLLPAHEQRNWSRQAGCE